MQKTQNTKQNNRNKQDKSNHKTISAFNKSGPRLHKAGPKSLTLGHIHLNQLLPDQILIYGKHSVFSAIKNKKRKVFQILTSQNNISELEKFITQNNLSNLTPLIKLVDNSQIESLVGRDPTHQGIIAICLRLPTKNQNDLLEEIGKIQKNIDAGLDEKLPNLLLLDQLSDPQNIGAIIRSAVSFGVKKIIFCEHNAPKENSAMCKASAGTIDLVDLIVVTNFNNLIEKLKKINYWCIGLDGHAKTFISEVKNYNNIALVVGSEGSGIRELVKKNCDILTRIEIDKSVESLNASVATSIALYELFRK